MESCPFKENHLFVSRQTIEEPSSARVPSSVSQSKFFARGTTNISQVSLEQAWHSASFVAMFS
jgi:hypothetical protein